ncbi:MAG TPA: PAS domain-containing protein, partial [Clostridia bacterium]
YNAGGTLVYSTSFDDVSGTFSNLGSETTDFLEKRVLSDDLQESGALLVYLDGEYHMLAFSRTTDSQRLLKPNGVLFFGRTLDADMLSNLTAIVGGQIVLTTMGELDPAMRAGLAVPASAQPPSVVSTVDEKTRLAKVYLLLPQSGEGAQAVVVSVVRDMEMFSAGIAQWGLLRTGFSVVFILIALSAVLYINRRVARPIADMIDAVAAVDLTANRFDRLPVVGRDSLAKLAGSVNRMLERIDTTQTDLRYSEEQLRTIFEQAPFGISLSDSLTGKILQVNQRFENITGRSRKELLTLN